MANETATQRIANLTDSEIVALRQDVVLDSLYVSDYENRFGIDPKAVCDFFEGYVEYLGELADEDECEAIDLFDEYDTADNLIAWRDIVAC